MTVQKIDPELCNGCGVCVNSCTMDVIRLDTVVQEKGEYPPCQIACPAGVDMRRYIRLLQDGMTEEALEVILEALPFPAITGRICPHPCEAECARREIDEAVNINSLERFAADRAFQEKPKSVRKIYSSRVAVIGSGPAGLAAAYELNKSGYPVTVFESLPAPGGMLRYGVPEFRLPKNVLDAQIEYIRDAGVEFQTNAELGRDFAVKDLENQGYKAVFLALGARLSRRIEVPGSDLDGVLWGMDFLRETSVKHEVDLKGKVLIIGGGNVAVDVALTALRLGAAEVRLASLESTEEMPAFKEEIRQAVDEGIILHPSRGPARFVGEGNRVSRVELVKCASVFDRQGQFNPVYDSSTVETFPVDTVILAVGQASDASSVPANIKVSRSGKIPIDPLTMETSSLGIFAGGDIASDQGTVIEAIAAGKRAAASIDRYLKGQDPREKTGVRPPRVSYPPKERIEKFPRQVMPLLPASGRRLNFNEVKLGFDEDLARLEAGRCTTCGSRAFIRYPEDCADCDSCEGNCPRNAIYVSPERTMPLMVGWR